jgi:hypothetical protein
MADPGGHFCVFFVEIGNQSTILRSTKQLEGRNKDRKGKQEKNEKQAKESGRKAMGISLKQKKTNRDETETLL